MKVPRMAAAAILVIASLGLACGCRSAPNRTPEAAAPAVSLRPFTLYVCNQSPAITPVDIRIEVDGKVVVQEDFEVGRQLNWKTFDLVLAPGEHAIRVASEKGEAELSQGFTVVSEYGASVEYWYYPDGHRFATPRHFRFGLLGGPPPAGEPGFPPAQPAAVVPARG